MPSKTPSPLYNIVAQVAGWVQPGGGRVRLLTDIPGHKVGTELVAHVMEDPRRTVQLDFEHRRRKHGLRQDGIVLLRKTAITEDGELMCRELEVVNPSRNDGMAVVLRESAAFITPLPPNSQSHVRESGKVAVLKKRTKVRTREDVLAAVREHHEEICIFGEAMFVLTGEDASGSARELNIATPQNADLEACVAQAVDDATASIMKAGGRWFVVPVFTAPLDTDAQRRGKISAQATNHDYGTVEEPLWTPTNAVMRTMGKSWMISETSPFVDGKDATPVLLLDLIDIDD